MDIEEIKDFVYEVRTFGITSNDAKFVQITEYLLSELEKEKEKNKTKIISDSFHKYVGKKFDKEFISKDKLEVILEKYKHTKLGDDEKILKFYKELQSLIKEE